MKAGAGGGNPSKPQGAFGGPRQIGKRRTIDLWRLAAAA
jgi:hypothetical protein